MQLTNGVKCLLSNMLHSKQMAFINGRVRRADRRNRLDTFLYTKRETNEYNILYYVLHDDKTLINLKKVSWKTFICIVVTLSKILFIFIYDIILWLFEIRLNTASEIIIIFRLSYTQLFIFCKNIFLFTYKIQIKHYLRILKSYIF